MASLAPSASRPTIRFEDTVLSRCFLRHLAIAVITLVLAFVVRGTGADAQATETLNGICLSFFLLTALANVTNSILKDPYLVWSPLTLFILSSLVFVGFGPLVHNLGNESTQNFLALRPPAAYPPEVTRALILTMVGQVSFCVGILAWLAFKGRDAHDEDRRRATASLFTPGQLAYFFLAIGLLFKYALFFPSMWGLIDFEIPGVFTQINALASLGFGMWAYVATRRGGITLVLFVVALGIDLFLTSAAFSKRLLLLDLIFPLAGYYLASGNRYMTFGGACLTAVVFVVSQPLVAYGRQSLGGQDVVAPLSERLAIVEEYFTEDVEDAVQVRFGDYQGWWTRLDATGRQAFAMSLRDTKIPSYSLESVTYLFIPRLIWPDKPIFEPPGRRFYYLVTGRATNNMSPTLYADLYWQFGWLGVVIISALCGVVLAAMHLILIGNIRSLNFVYFPAVLIAAQCALLGANTFLINGFLTTIPMFAIYMLFLTFVVRSMRQRA